MEQASLWKRPLFRMIPFGNGIMGNMRKKTGFHFFNSTLFLTCMAMFALILGLSGCNIPTPQQLPSDPTADINLILTQLAEEHQAGLPTGTKTSSEIETEPTDEPTETPEPTPTPKKMETLTVCLGKEPETLFFYAESSQAMWSVLESIYNGPFDTGSGKTDPVIFEDISVITEPVTIVRGDVIVDFDGDPVELKNGTVFMPANPNPDCVGSNCNLELFLHGGRNRANNDYIPPERELILERWHAINRRRLCLFHDSERYERDQRLQAPIQSH